MSYLRLNYIGKSSLRLVIRENEKKEPAYITKYQYQSKLRQKASSTPPVGLELQLYRILSCYLSTKGS
jgi:SPX domain protein involved in polyphosphate accumulation